MNSTYYRLGTVTKARRTKRMKRAGQNKNIRAFVKLSGNMLVAKKGPRKCAPFLLRVKGNTSDSRI